MKLALHPDTYFKDVIQTNILNEGLTVVLIIYYTLLLSLMLIFYYTVLSRLH